MGNPRTTPGHSVPHERKTKSSHGNSIPADHMTTPGQPRDNPGTTPGQPRDNRGPQLGGGVRTPDPTTFDYFDFKAGRGWLLERGPVRVPLGKGRGSSISLPRGGWLPRRGPIRPPWARGADRLLVAPRSLLVRPRRQLPSCFPAPSLLVRQRRPPPPWPRGLC